MLSPNYGAYFTAYLLIYISQQFIVYSIYCRFIALLTIPRVIM